ncbi:hypothetical protein QJS10_CPB17g00347 [Acorus calamus]|uniref:Uncharacterized protein n=1 Tax=Acorus calamus TaxID=4465 RepID=A0AAV9CYE8_ACOCL|nr:hypothetical protein QJS10_CPB17g00347 [Acorus calamus]
MAFLFTLNHQTLYKDHNMITKTGFAAATIAVIEQIENDVAESFSFVFHSIKGTEESLIQ